MNGKQLYELALFGRRYFNYLSSETQQTVDSIISALQKSALSNDENAKNLLEKIQAQEIAWEKTEPQIETLTVTEPIDEMPKIANDFLSQESNLPFKEESSSINQANVNEKFQTVPETLDVAASINNLPQSQAFQEEIGMARTLVKTPILEERKAGYVHVFIIMYIVLAFALLVIFTMIILQN